MSRIERTTDKYDRALVKELMRAKAEPADPNAPTDPIEFMRWLNAEPPYDKET